MIDEEEVDVMVGSSMDGMFANVINGVAKVLVNPSFHVSESMRKKIGTMQFFSKRKDGATEFEITDDLCDAMRNWSKDNLHSFMNVTQEKHSRCSATMIIQ